MSDRNTTASNASYICNVSNELYLRDFFAGCALQGFCANMEFAQDAKDISETMAEEAYAFADAMIAERAKSTDDSL